MPAKGHALLGASSSHIWLVCNPSARLCEFVEDQDSAQSEEGTTAHEIAEQKVKKVVEDIIQHGRS